MARFESGYNLRRAMLEAIQQHAPKQMIYGPRRDVPAIDLLREATHISQLIRESRLTDQQVGVLIPPSVDYLAALMACWLIGVPAMPIDPFLTEGELAHTLRPSGVEFLLTHTSMRAALQNMADHKGINIDPLYVNTERRLLEEATPVSQQLLDPNRFIAELLSQTDPSTPRAPALVMPHSGGGRFPVFTHENVLAALSSLDSLVWLRPNDLAECQLPMHSLEGILLGLCMPLLDGASLNVGAALEESTTVRIGPGGPAEIGGCPLVAMRPIDDREWRGILCSEECGGPFAVLTQESPQMIFDILPSLRAEVRDENGDPISPGESGRLHIQGLPVMIGYLNDTESTDQVLTPDNWLDTGVRVSLLGDGRIQVLTALD